MKAYISILLVMITSYILFSLNISLIEEYPFEGFYSNESVQISENRFVCAHNNKVSLVQVSNQEEVVLDTETTNYWNKLMCYYDGKIYALQDVVGYNVFQVNEDQIDLIDTYTIEPNFDGDYIPLMLQVHENYLFMMYVVGDAGNYFYRTIIVDLNDQSIVYSVDEMENATFHVSRFGETLFFIRYNGQVDYININALSWEFSSTNLCLPSNAVVLKIITTEDGLYSVCHNESHMTIQYYEYDNMTFTLLYETSSNYNGGSWNFTKLNDKLIVNLINPVEGSSLSKIFNITDNGIEYEATKYYDNMIINIHPYNGQYIALSKNQILIMDNQFEIETEIKEFSADLSFHNYLKNNVAVLREISSTIYKIKNYITGEILLETSDIPCHTCSRNFMAKNALFVSSFHDLENYTVDDNGNLIHESYHFDIPFRKGQSILGDKAFVGTTFNNYNLYQLSETEDPTLITSIQVDFDEGCPYIIDDQHFIIIKNLLYSGACYYYKLSENNELELLEIFPFLNPNIYISPNHIISTYTNGEIINISDRDNPYLQGNLDIFFPVNSTRVTYNGNGSYLFSACYKQIITDNEFNELDWWYEYTSAKFIDESHILKGKFNHLALWEVEEFADSEDVQIPTPSQYSLTNHPNPFKPAGAGRSPGTTISFKLADFGDMESVSVEIYNIKGQRIKQLVSNSANQLSEGEHSVVWDGTDNQNKPVSSGVYFYTLKLGDRVVASKKMLLLK